jgi:hypothetical protein
MFVVDTDKCWSLYAHSEKRKMEAMVMIVVRAASTVGMKQ